MDRLNVDVLLFFDSKVRSRRFKFVSPVFGDNVLNKFEEFQISIGGVTFQFTRRVLREMTCFDESWKVVQQ